jgi:hypothetical protein
VKEAFIIEVPMSLPIPTFRLVPLAGALAGVLGLLAGCVPPPPPVPMPLVAEAGDPCGRQVTEFSGIAGYFSEPDPRAPALETLEVELQSESNALERLQIAFGTLVQCRWAEAKAAPGAIGRLRRDAAQAAMIRDLAEARGQRLDAAVNRASPGARVAISAALGSSAVVPQAMTGTAVELRLRPDFSSAIMARLPPGTRARVQPGPGEFAMVDAGPEARGYAPASAFILVPEVQVMGGDPSAGRLLSLAATGAARRGAFARAVAMAEQPPRY